MSIKSDAQKKAVAKYNAANYEQIILRVKRGMKEKIRVHARRQGESLNGFVNRAIDETIARESAGNTEE